MGRFQFDLTTAVRRNAVATRFVGGRDYRVRSSRSRTPGLGEPMGSYGRRWQGAPTIGTFRLLTLNRASVGGDRRLYELVANRDPFHVHRAECVRARPRRQPAAMEWSCMNRS